MRVTKELIEELGGLNVDLEEGGGCTFYLDNKHRIDLTKEEMPKTAIDLIQLLLDEAYKYGKEMGAKEVQKSLRKTLGIEK